MKNYKIFDRDSKVVQWDRTANDLDIKIIESVWGIDYVWFFEEEGVLDYEGETINIPANSVAIKFYGNKKKNLKSRIIVIDDKIACELIKACAEQFNTPLNSEPCESVSCSEESK